jgi:hypothetical protein
MQASSGRVGFDRADYGVHTGVRRIDTDSDQDDDRLNRNLEQLLEELRVVLPGIQVLLAFLLAVPFATRFGLVDAFDRRVFLVALLLAAASSVLLMAPSIHHRLLFHRGQKEYLVELGSRLAIAGFTLLALAVSTALLVVADVVEGRTTAWIVFAGSLVLYGATWYAVPLRRRSEIEHPPTAQAPASGPVDTRRGGTSSSSHTRAS